MGGKGIRRREKNYEAAHGQANTRLPPPPEPSSLDAVPSKLRKLMSLGAPKQPFNRGNKNTEKGVDKGLHSGEGTESTTTGVKRKGNDQELMEQLKEYGGEFHQMSMSEKKKKKKKKGKKAVDLRFEKFGEPAAGVSQRKERKKQRLEARKKKNKKSRKEDDHDFPCREEIKFGDVQEPPKLIAVPKAFKTGQDASQERLRLQAVEAYRKRKGWESRPGVKLPLPIFNE